MKGDKILGAYMQFVSALYHGGTYGKGVKINGTSSTVGFFYGEGVPEDIKPECYCALVTELYMANPYDDDDDACRLYVKVLNAGFFDEEHFKGQLGKIRNSVQFILAQYLHKFVRYESDNNSNKEFLFYLYE